MRKVLIAIGMLVGLYFLAVPIRGYFWRAEAAQYTTDALLAIMKPWNATSYLERASESLKASPQEALVQRIDVASQQFGHFSRISAGPTCALFLGISSFDKKQRTYSKCTATVVFEKHSSSVTVILIEVSGDWYINDLIFQSCESPKCNLTCQCT
jgi:hypothetical protein